MKELYSILKKIEQTFKILGKPVNKKETGLFEIT